MAAAVGPEPVGLPPGAVRIPLQTGPWTVSHFMPVKADCYPLEWDQLYNTIQEINSAIHNSGVIAYKRMVTAARNVLLGIAGIAALFLAVSSWRSGGGEGTYGRSALAFATFALGIIAFMGYRKWAVLADQQMREALAGKLAEVNARLAPQAVEFLLDEEHSARGKGRSQIKMSLVVKPLQDAIPAVTVVGTVTTPYVVTATVVNADASPIPAAAGVVVGTS
eukprot:CAMPEP_0178388076 /NCGR_PEP_ID=MMETSP0689_2-20121128/9404_1 /TAXON_ID=160604 /ORGANISM="Amphidinium massartii, Strain CS-259" /LENGTH=221 /DNA_ID=CAMNT_0020008463 /DNA_START=44 /DNA_END=705 /DNA_ORIENTATION=+